MAKSQTREQLHAVILPAFADLPDARTTFDGYATTYATAAAFLMTQAFVQERATGLGKDMVERARRHLQTINPAEMMTSLAALIEGAHVSGMGNIAKIAITGDTDVSVTHDRIMVSGSWTGYMPSATLDAIVTREDRTPTDRRRIDLDEMVACLATDGVVVARGEWTDGIVTFPVPGSDRRHQPAATVVLDAHRAAHGRMGNILPEVKRQLENIRLRTLATPAALQRREEIARRIRIDLADGPHRLLEIWSVDNGDEAFHYGLRIGGIGENLKPTVVDMTIHHAADDIEETVSTFRNGDLARFLRRQRVLMDKGQPLHDGDYHIDRPLARMLKETFGDRAMAVVREAIETGSYQSGSHMPAESGRRDVTLTVTMDQGILRGRFPIAEGATWRDGTLRIAGVSIPEMVAQEMRGKRLSDVVRHDWLDDDMIIEAVSRGGTGLTLSAQKSIGTVAEALG